MTRLLHALALGALMAALTWLVGWWMVPLCAAAYGAVAARTHGAPFVAAAAALLAWGGLLGTVAARGPFGTLAQVLGGLLKMGDTAVVLLTLAYPMLLALTAAMVGRALAWLVARPTSPVRPA